MINLNFNVSIEYQDFQVDNVEEVCESIKRQLKAYKNIGKIENYTVEDFDSQEI